MFERPDTELDNAMALAASDPQQAAQVLRIAARYLKKREPFSLIGRSSDRKLGKTYLPCPVMGCTPLKMARACVDRGTM